MDQKQMEALNANINKIWVKMKEMYDEQGKEVKTLGEAKSETKEVIARLEAQMAELEKKAARPLAGNSGSTNGEGTKEVDVKQKELYFKCIRRGIDKLTPEEQKSVMTKSVMTATDDTTGGYFCMPEELSGELIKDIVEYSPVREVARVRNTSKRSVKIRKKTGTVTGGAWVQEIGTRSSLGVVNYGMIEIPNHELAGYVDISNQDLEDPDFDIEADMKLEIAEQFGVTEAAAFIEGNGINKPEGLLNTTTDRELGKVANGHATDLQADALIDMYYALKTAYVKGAKWMLNRSTLKEVRKLKDGNGNYLWTPAISIAKPSTILETPYIDCTDMPDIGANTYPIILGDFTKAYMIVDRKQIVVLRDPYTQATTGTTRFHFTKRVGGQVIKTEAAKKLKIATTV